VQWFGFLHVSLLLAVWSSRSRQRALEMRTSATVEVAADLRVIPAVLAQARTGQIGHFSRCGLCSKTSDIAS